MADSAFQDHDRHAATRLVWALEAVLALGVVLGVVAVVGVLLSPPGLGIIGGERPTITAELLHPADPVVDEGSVVTSRPVAFGAPVTAQVALLAPTGWQRALWLARELSGPLLVLVGLWLVRSVVRTARHGDPFVTSNVARLWGLAFLVAVGGTGNSMFVSFADALLLHRSSASDLVALSFSVSFLPLLLGVGIAVLAGVWQVGVGLRDEVAGTI